MPNSVKVCVGIILATFILIPISASISFIYHDRYLLTFIIGYLLLVIWFSSYVIYEHNINKNAVKKLRNNKWVIYFSFFVFPLFFGNTLTFLAPLSATLTASEFAIHEYKLIRVEPYASTFRHLSKMHAVDIKNNEVSFVVKNDTLDQLSLRSDKTLIIRGRNCIAGFVIDDINGVKLK
jgi:hypothetical protein